MRKIAIFYLFYSISLYAIPDYNSALQSQINHTPWFTGPLLAPAGNVFPPGHIGWQLYLFMQDTVTRPKIVSLFFLNLGLTPFVDSAITINTSHNSSSVIQMGDSAINFGFQLLKESYQTPSLRLTYTQIFPTGKYQKLNRAKKGSDSSGNGAFSPIISANFAKQFPLSSTHYFNTRLSFSFAYYPPVFVRGYNTYGGGLGTDGKVSPGNFYTITFAFEYNITQNLAVAMDIQYAHNNRTRFHGKKGITSTGEQATIRQASNDQLSLAPALEYNWSANVGVIGGVWFSILEKNIAAFINGVFSIVVTY